MKKANKFDEIRDGKAQRLRLAKRATEKLQVVQNNRQQRSQKFMGHGSSGGGKGRVSVQGATVMVKSNYQVAGRRYKDGIASRKAVGSHASASLNYMNSHGADDIKDQELSNIYDEIGERLTQDELKDLMKSLREDEENQAMRRTVISIDKEGLTREDLSQIVRESLHEFKEQTGNSFDFKYAIHTDTENIHAHVLATGDAKDIMISKEQLRDFKLIVAEKTEEVVKEKELSLDNKIEKLIENEIDKANEKSLTLNQQIDKELDGKLDDKFREEDLEKAIKEAYEKDHTNDRSLGL